MNRDILSFADIFSLDLRDYCYTHEGHEILKIVLIQEFLSSLLFYFMWLVIRHFEFDSKNQRLRVFICPLLISLVYFSA